MSYFTSIFPVIPTKGPNKRAIKSHRAMFFRPTWQVYGHQDEAGLLKRYDEKIKQRFEDRQRKART